MPGTLRLVAPGNSALQALRGAIVAAKREDPFAPVTVVVPSAATRLRLRHELVALEEPAPLLHVRFVLLRELADELAREVIGARMRATRLIVRTMCARALERSGGFLAPVARHRSSADELALIYETVGFARSDALEVLASLGGRRAELASLLAAVRAGLSASFVDDVDVFDAAVRAATHEGVVALGAVVVHAPIRIRGVEARLLGRLGELGVLEVLLLTTAPEDPVAKRMASRLLATGIVRASEVSSSTICDAEEHLDAREEVGRAFSRILEELEAGARPEELAICFAAHDPYLALVERRATELGLELSGPTHQRLDEAPLARLLLGFLELARLGVTRTRLVNWLASAPLEGELGRLIRRDAIDRVTRVAGIGDEELSAWRARLETAIDDARRDAAASPNAPTSARQRASRAQRTRLEAMALLSALGELQSYLERARAITGFREGVSLCRELVVALCGESAGMSDGAIAADVLVLEILDQLSVLERTGVRGGLEPFASALEVALDRPAPTSGAPGRGVLVGRLEAAHGLALRAVVVLGVIEGNVPQTERAGALLDAATEEELAVDEAAPAERLERERYRLLSCIGAGARVLVTVPRFELRTGRLLLRSRFVDGAIRPADGERTTAQSRAELEADALARGEHVPVRDSPVLARLATVQTSRAAQRFDAYSGRIDAEGLLDGLSGAGFSPTPLERYAACPLQYFFDRELAIEALDPPESRLSISPLERGSLAHRVLERLVVRLVRDGEVDDADERALLFELFEEESAALEARGLTGKEVAWIHERRRLARVLEGERRRDRDRRAKGRRPIAAEHGFGLGGAPPVEVALSKTTLSFRGSIDRVDELADGSLAVVDYKTGRADSYEGLDDDPVDRGRHLQLAIYARAAAALSGDRAPRDVSHAAYRLLDEDGREFEVPANAATAQRLEEVLEVVTGSIQAGLFPARPGPDQWGGPLNCRRCNFAPACRSDRGVHFRAISDRAELRPYVELADGVEEDG